MRGVHFAIDDAQLAALRAHAPADRYEYVSNVIEEAWAENFATETDKAWGLIHQTLVGANPCADELDPGSVDRPLSLAIVGEEFLYSGDDGMIALVERVNVPAVRDALENFGTEQFRSRLRSLAEHHKCANVADEDLDYASHWFENLKKAYSAAASHDRHVIFTVDW